MLRPWLGYLLLVLVLWPSLLQLPRPASVEIFDGPAMALDYAVRHGISLADSVPTTTGPLGALLTGIHSGQLLWLSYWCQVLVSLGIALGLAWILLRLKGTARLWLGGGILFIAGFRPEYLHLSLLALGGILLMTRPLLWLEAAGVGFILGLLSLIDSRYACFGLLAIGLSRAALPGPTARRTLWVGGGAMITVLISGWIGSGQPPGDLPVWLWHGLISSPLRHQATTAYWQESTMACAAVTWFLLVALLTGAVSAAPRRLGTLLLAVFLLTILGHSWREATGQPGVMPQTFFATALMAGLGWLTLRPGGGDGWLLRGTAAAAMAAAGLGLLTVEARILTESVILLNQKIGANLTALSDRRGWQGSLNRSFQSSAQLFALPRIKAAMAGRPADLLGNAIGYALLNGINYAPRPGLQSFRVAEGSLAELDAGYYAGPTAPAFVIQRLHAFDNGLPALEDASAQAALYAHYDFLFEENGFVLWQHEPAAFTPGVVPRQPLWHAVADWGREVSLPVTAGHSYWLSIKTHRSVCGWLRYQLLPPVDPVLLLRDAEGSLLSYRASPAAFAGGFLLNPLFRGEIDLVRYEAGTRPPLIREITVQPSAGRDGDFSGPVEITLWDAATPAVSGRTDSAARLAEKFRIANRLPVAMAAYYPPQITTPEKKDLLMMHPDSSLEFSVRPGDTGLRGRFGLLPGAYENGNATDGVEFVIEYMPASGRSAVLWRRHLDPLQEPADRGLQEFSVTLPQPASGRLVLRTQNLPGHNAAWDWSFWTDLRFEPSPATK